jgi:hypothetical protein
MVKYGLQAIALNQRLALRSALWTQRGLAQLRALSLPTYATRRRDDNLELLAWLTTRIDELDDRIAASAAADPRVRLLLRRDLQRSATLRLPYSAGIRIRLDTSWQPL